jgi:hypothetical protein
MTTAQHPPGERPTIKYYLLAYNVLCTRANVPYLTRNVGDYLADIAEWCASNEWPALNSLAVNADSHMPGEGYDGAGGFNIVNWPTEVIDCIRFKAYPLQMPK